MKREITQAERNAYLELARAAASLRCAQARANRKRAARQNTKKGVQK